MLGNPIHSKMKYSVKNIYSTNAEGQFLIFSKHKLSLHGEIMGDFNFLVYLYFQDFLKWTCII